MDLRVSDVRLVSFPTWREIQAHAESDAVDRSFLIRYCFPAGLKELLDAQNGDRFVPALLLPAMRLGEQLEIPAPASHSSSLALESMRDMPVVCSARSSRLL